MRNIQVRNEIAILKKVSMGHKNIVTMVDYFETNNNLYLVTDLALGGNLFDHIFQKASYYESDAAGFVHAILSAVAYLHDHDIVHRDLKPENLLFRTPEDDELLITDFGLSRIMGEKEFHDLRTPDFDPIRIMGAKKFHDLRTLCFPECIAPEAFNKTSQGKPVDVWAIGVITYLLLCGYTPFDRYGDFEQMPSAEYSFQPADHWRGVSSDAKDFIRQCLTIDPNRRMTVHEALRHTFVARIPDGYNYQNLLPNVMLNFNARRMAHTAINTELS